MAHHLNLVDAGRGEHERSLHTNVVGDPANGEGPIELLRSMLADHDPFEDLDALFAAFDDAHVDAYRVADLDDGALGSFSVDQLV
jgi:hypothetical protein